MIRLRRTFRREPDKKWLVLIVGSALLFLGSTVLLPSLTNSADVPVSLVAAEDKVFTPNDLLPQDCKDAGISVTRIVSGGVTVTGDNDGNLLLADSSTTAMVGGTGDDCIVANAVADIDGGTGNNDVCIGWGTTQFTSCEQEIRQ